MRENLKRIAALLLAAIMLAGFVGCSPRIDLDDDYDWDGYEDDDDQMYVTTTGDSWTTDPTTYSTDAPTESVTTCPSSSTTRYTTTGTVRPSTTLPTTQKPTTTQTTTQKPTTVTHVHVYSQATCTRPATCSCGATTGTSLGHSWTAATCIARQTCTRCGTTTGSYGSHSWVEATYTSPKRCTVCGTTTGSKLERKWNGIAAETDKKKYVFGEKFDEDTLLIYKTFTDGSRETIKNSHCEITGFSSASFGKNTLTITYDNGEREFSTTLDLEIILDDINIMKFKAFKSADGDHLYTKRDAYDSYGVYYDKCYYFQSYSYVTYRLAGNFSRFTGTVVVPKSTYKAIIKIYADDVLIYSKDMIEDEVAAFKIDLNVAECNFLKIEVSNDSLMLYDAWLKA